MSDSGAPPQAKGGGQAGDRRDAANSLLQFLQPKAGAAHIPPAAPLRPTEATGDGRLHTPQQQHINTERLAFDGETPIIEQMLPEIAQANKPAKNTNMRGTLAIARGYVTGVRANGTTTGSALWAELLQRDGQCRHGLWFR